MRGLAVKDRRDGFQERFAQAGFWHQAITECVEENLKLEDSEMIQFRVDLEEARLRRTWAGRHVSLSLRGEGMGPVLLIWIWFVIRSFTTGQTDPAPWYGSSFNKGLFQALNWGVLSSQRTMCKPYRGLRFAKSSYLCWAMGPAHESTEWLSESNALCGCSWPMNHPGSWRDQEVTTSRAGGLRASAPSGRHACLSKGRKQPQNRKELAQPQGQSLPSLSWFRHWPGAIYVSSLGASLRSEKPTTPGMTACLWAILSRIRLLILHIFYSFPTMC